ncbi:MAG: hypothetical protein NZ518_01170, partial [Dehalococcoidia bacterium]|nr:hypothetical protein [Dehalococcoidia bacterium]
MVGEGIERPDVVLFTEHVARELDIACAVKYLAKERHGVEVYVTSVIHGLLKTLSTVPQPLVVAAPYAYNAQNDCIRDILSVWPTATYVNLHYEQFVDRTTAGVLPPRDEFAVFRMLHHCWGEFFVDFLAQWGVPRDSMVINGNPSLELYRPPQARYFADSRATLAAKHGLDPAKRWVLITETYGVAFLGDDMLKTYVQAGSDPSEVWMSRRQHQVAFVEVARWIRQAALIADVELIVRPHPVTPMAQFVEPFINATGPIPRNLRFIKDGSVREWIIAADGVAASFSTTMIEAAVAQKPTYLLEPIPFADATIVPWMALVPRIKDFIGFMDFVLGRAPTTDWKYLHQWAVQTMLTTGNAIVNLADILAMVAKRDPRIPERLYQGGDPFGAGADPSDARFQYNPPTTTALHEMDNYDQDEVARRVAKRAS